MPWAELSAGVIKALGEDAFVLEWPRSGEVDPRLLSYNVLWILGLPTSKRSAAEKTG